MKKFALAISFLTVCCLPVFGGKDDPPDDPPSECCGSGYEKQATYDPPKCGDKGDDPPPIGGMSDVSIYVGQNPPRLVSGTGFCVEYSTGTATQLYAGGGSDTDVCVQTENVQNNCPQYSGYGVNSSYVWSGQGSPDANNPGIFNFIPPAPGQYTVTLTSTEGDGDCNVGGESKTTQTTIIAYSISPIRPEGIQDVNRGDSQTWNIEVQPSSMPVTYFWSSSATTEHGTGASWGGEHCTGYTLTCTVTTTCPLDQSPISTTKVKVVDVLKGRTFNAYGTNTPKRYPVPTSMSNRSGLEPYTTDACNNGSYGETWVWPWPGGDDQGTSMAQNINAKRISSGPNSGKWYVGDMSSVDFTIDTNTNYSFTDSSTTWYANHTAVGVPASAQPPIQHTQCQVHEERHATHVIQAEMEMDGSPGKPLDMYDACEDAVADSKTALIGTVAGRLNSLIDWIDQRSLEIDADDHVDDDGWSQHCDDWFPDCDYFKFFGCPGYMNCTPGSDCPGGC